MGWMREWDFGTLEASLIRIRRKRYRTPTKRRIANRRTWSRRFLSLFTTGHTMAHSSAQITNSKNGGESDKKARGKKLSASVLQIKRPSPN